MIRLLSSKKFRQPQAALMAVMLAASIPAWAYAMPQTPDVQAADAQAVLPSPTISAGSGLAPPPSPSNMESDPERLMRAANDAASQAESAEEERKKQMQRIKQQIYENSVEGLLPLSEDQIRGYMKRLESTQEAAVPPSYGQPKGEIKVHTVSLDPSATPPQLDTVPGYITTMTFVDASGQPWPIADIGVAGNFEVKPTGTGSHILRVIPLASKGVGNMSVMLKDLPTPVIFRLWSGGPNLHWRYDARIPKYGPNANIPLIDRRVLTAGDETIMMFLENAPPAGAKRLKVSGLDARTMAWLMNDKVYVRTPLAMLSPSWDASVASADGTTVYQIADAPVLLMSDAGNMLRARLARDVNDD
jgi:intracellular multiplication protein IcmK